MRSRTRPSENTNKERAWGDEASGDLGTVCLGDTMCVGDTVCLGEKGRESHYKIQSMRSKCSLIYVLMLK